MSPRATIIKLSMVAVLIFAAVSACGDGRTAPALDQDGGVDARDGAAMDLSLDTRALDLTSPDVARGDLQLPDQVPPDQRAPDQHVPDLLVPDLLVPDLLMPDLPLPTCTDKAKNGAETDVDCGGPACPACADTKMCKKHLDCVSLICLNSTCQKPTCVDLAQNGAETDVDCGGPACPACASGKACTSHDDCAGICIGSSCRWAATCKELLSARPGTKSGSYTLDPDGPAATVPAFTAHCDMTHASGGWTLYYSTTQSAPAPTQSASVAPGSSAHLSAAAVMALAKLASQVHIRATGKASTRSVTSKAHSKPIQNLRLLNILNLGHSLSDWSGPMSPATYLRNTCSVGGTYPGYSYWACGNQGGLHLNKAASQSRWVYTAANEPIELYVR